LKIKKNLVVKYTTAHKTAKKKVLFFWFVLVLLGGFGLFGGRGEYFGKIKVGSNILVFVSCFRV